MVAIHMDGMEYVENKRRDVESVQPKCHQKNDTCPRYDLAAVGSTSAACRNFKSFSGNKGLPDSIMRVMNSGCREHICALRFMATRVRLVEICGMWAKLIVSATLLPGMVHSIFGCCWHHAHSAETVKFVAVAAADQSLIHCHGHHHCCHQEKSNVPTPCEDHKSCDDMSCVYLTVKAVRSESLPNLREVVAASDSVHVPLLNATVMASGDSHPGLCVSSSLQHRALTQVWVV